MNICEHLTATARLFPDREALVFESSSYSYAELDRLSGSAAQVLAKAGVEPGDRVAIMLPNVPAFAVWYYGALRLGAIALSISTRSVAEEVSFVLQDSGAKVLVADQGAGELVAAALADTPVTSLLVSEDGRQCGGALLADAEGDSTWFHAEPHAPAQILYTSGTTGVPKGATLSHANVRSNVHAFNHLCDMQSSDRILLAVPLFHCFGQNALLNSALNVGATLVLQRSFDLSESKRLIAQQQVTQLYGVPTMFKLFLESCTPEDLATVRYCFSAAAPLPVQVSKLWQETYGQPIYEGYGLTETSPFASYNHPLEYRLGSIGVPIDNVEMRIVDAETGQECPVGELGEIAIRGPNVMLGYWNRPDETAAVLRAGWFHSGDIGRVDEHGYFTIVDRLKDMIAVGGLKVFPAEVERVLHDHPAVSEVAVVGHPDEVFGEQVVAFVVPAAEVGDPLQLVEEIKSFGQSHLANYKAPRSVVLLESLPRNPSGKVLKKELRQQELAPVAMVGGGDQPGSSATAVPAPRLRPLLAETHAASHERLAIEYVQALVGQLTGSTEVPAPAARFLDLGMDSLMIVEASSQLQAEVGSENPLPATLIFDHPRVCDLASFLVATLTSESNAATPGSESNAATATTGPDLREAIESMTEEQAYEELMRELGTA